MHQRTPSERLQWQQCRRQAARVVALPAAGRVAVSLTPRSVDCSQCLLNGGRCMGPSRGSSSRTAAAAARAAAGWAAAAGSWARRQVWSWRRVNTRRWWPPKSDGAPVPVNEQRGSRWRRRVLGSGGDAHLLLAPRLLPRQTHHYVEVLACSFWGAASCVASPCSFLRPWTPCIAFLAAAGGCKAKATDLAAACRSLSCRPQQGPRASLHRLASLPECHADVARQ